MLYECTVYWCRGNYEDRTYHQQIKRPAARRHTRTRERVAKTTSKVSVV